MIYSKEGLQISTMIFNKIKFWLEFLSLNYQLKNGRLLLHFKNQPCNQGVAEQLGHA